MTLTEASFWTKRFGIIVVVFITVFLLALLIIFSSQTTTLPAQYLTANYACTEFKEDFLEHRLEIESLEVKPDSELIFELQTDSGKIDSLPRIVNVYSYTNLGQRLNSQAEAKILAKKMGFDPDRMVRQGTSGYIWGNNEHKRSLFVSARDINFTMKTDIDTIRKIRREADLPTEREAPSLATNALRHLGILDQVYTEVPPTVRLIDINPDGSFSQADSLLNAELIRVDFMRKVPMISIAKNLEGAEQMVNSLTKRDLSYEVGTAYINDERVEVYNFSTLVTYHNPVKSNITVYIGAKQPDLMILPNVYQIEFNTWKVEQEPCGTYELISPSLALQRIQNGEGSLVYLNSLGDEIRDYIPQSVRKFRVDNMYITYYEGPREQQFSQPVYMVEGQAELRGGERADFFIYYPAINYSIVQDRIELPPPLLKKKSGLF
jgi:hypothetical protein